MNMKSVIRPLALFGFATGILSLDLYGQHNMRPLTTEISASAGGLFDLPSATASVTVCQSGTTDCNQQLRPGKVLLPMVNGEVAVSFTRFFWLYGEYNYVFPDRQSASATFGAITRHDAVNRHYWIATGGIELSFPNVHGMVPLLRFGGGEIHHSYSNVGTIDLMDARNIPAATVGGGVRWYLGERHGIRVMVNGFYLGHGVYDLEPSSLALTGGFPLLTTRRSGGSVTVGYFRQFGH